LLAFTQDVVAKSYIYAGSGNMAAGEFISHCATGLLFGLVVVVFALNGGLFSKLLGLKFFVVLGEISFALYMVHQIVFRFFNSHRPMFAGVPSELLFPLLSFIAIVSAYAIWRLVEIPSQRLLRKLLSRNNGNKPELVPSS